MRKTVSAFASTSVFVPSLLIVLGTGLGGCAHQNTLAGTTVIDTSDNRAVLETIEQYRLRLLEKNIEGLLVLASDHYFEDSGTPTAEDDYGYEGLKYALTKSLARVKSVRYDIQYRSVNVRGNRAEVEAYLSGAFELIAESGDRYRRVGDYHRFVLERDGKEKWKFLSGM
jgi:hypothetical protein